MLISKILVTTALIMGITILLFIGTLIIMFTQHQANSYGYNKCINYVATDSGIPAMCMDFVKEYNYIPTGSTNK